MLRVDRRRRPRSGAALLEALIALAILSSLSASLALADEFKTVSGKEYKNATVSRVEADGIVIKTNLKGLFY